MFNNTNSTELVGKTAIFLGHHEPVTFSNHFTRLRVDPERLDARYLARWLTKQQQSRLFEGLCTRWVGQSAVRSEKLLALKIPLPPLSEQQRIAAILDKTDSTRRKRRESVGLVDTLVRSVFCDMFGDPVTNSRGWKLVELSSYGKVTTGNTPSREHPEYYGDVIDWIKSDNINTPYHFLTKATESLSEEGKSVGRCVPSGSTLVTCIAGSPDCIGNAALADREVAFNQQINAITPLGQTDEYFLYALILTSKRLIQRSSSEAMKGMVSKSRFESIRVIDVPSESQKEFGCRFQKLMRLTNRLIESGSDAENLFASLTHRVFRGSL